MDGRVKSGRTPSSDATVLVVDDESGILDLVREILESEGHRIMTARSGAAALQLASEEPGPIHLLLTDISMPAMDGGELAQQMAILRPGTSVLFMSGSSPGEFGDEFPPRHRFIAKPFTPEALIEKVARVINGAC